MQRALLPPRLLTLSGTGGAGKTRLAQGVAAAWTGCRWPSSWQRPAARSSRRSIAWARMILGLVLRAAGEEQQARQHFLESLTEYCAAPESGYSGPFEGTPKGYRQAPVNWFPASSVTYALVGLGLIAGADRAWAQAMRLLSIGPAILAPCEAAARERVLAAARAALGDAAFEAAWSEGAALSLEGAVEYVLGL